MASDRKTTMNALKATIKLFEEHSTMTVSCNDYFTAMLQNALELLKEDQHQIWELQELNEYLKDKEHEFVPTVVDGKWIGEKCSVCGSEYIGSAPHKWKFCPDCGAKMKGR